MLIIELNAKSVGRTSASIFGAQDVTSCWDADGYPEIWLDNLGVIELKDTRLAA